jgi:hypothetical protein
MTHYFKINFESTRRFFCGSEEDEEEEEQDFE